MGFRINTNINAIDTQRNLMETSTNMSTTMRRLSSGLRINSAADDAAGLAISQKLNAQVTGLNQAVKNSQDGISLVQTAEGALNETQSILQRMRQLAVQSANDTNTSTDRTAIQSEMNQLATEISRISNTTSFNTKNLLAGGFKGQSFQIGANSGETMSLGIGAMDASSLGVAANGGTISATQNTANLSTLANVSSGFKNGVNYTVKSTALTAGSLTDTNGATAKAVTQGQNIGNETMNAEGAFAGTGSTATNYTIRAAALDTGGNINQIQYSTDGGSSWATSQGQMQKNGTYTFQVATSSATPTTDSGLTFNFSSPTTGAVAAAVGDQFTFSANPTQTALSLVPNLATTFSGLATAAGTIANTTAGAQGAYMGALSGDLKITATTGAGNTTTAVAVSIGGTALAAGAVAFTQAATKFNVTFSGMTFAVNGLASGGVGQTTYDLGNVNATSVATPNSAFATTNPANYSAGAVYAPAATAAGAALTAASVAAQTLNVATTGNYTGATGTLQLTTSATDWTSGSVAAKFFDSTGNATTVTALVTAAYSGGANATASADSTLKFTYQGSTFTMTGAGLNNTPVAGDTITLALANGTTTPGGDIAVTTATNTGASTATTNQLNGGNESLNTAGYFQGTTTTNYLLQATAVSGNQVTAAKFSTDGGTSWATATATAQGDGSYHFQAQQSSTGGTTGSGGDSGLTFSFTSPTNAIAPQVGDQFGVQAVAASTFASGTTAKITALGTGNISSGTAAAATVAGTYTGPYSGAIKIGVGISGAGVAGILDTLNSVQIGNTTLDKSQYVFTAATVAGGNATLKTMGMTYTFNFGTTTAVSTNANITMPTTLTAASNAQTANLAGAASVTTANNSGTAAATTTAASTQVGTGIPGLGSGAILLEVKNLNAGTATGTSSYAINSVGWLGAGAAAKTGGTFTVGATATSTDFSYNSSTTKDVYTAGAAYGGSLSVTGADGNTYKLVVSNSTTAGATVAIQNSTNTKTFATYNVTLGNVTGSANDGDVIALNLNQANVSAASTKNIGAETSGVSGTYTGSSNLQYTAKVSQLDTNGNATQIQLSTDGGQTYGAAITASGYTGSALATGTPTSFNLSNGLTFTLTPGQANQTKAAIGDSFNFTAMASASNGGAGSDLLQLQNTDSNGNTYNLGAAQLLQNNQTTATLGAANMTLTAGFNAVGTAGGVTAGSTSVTAQASQSAVIGSNGQVVSNATAYAGLDVTTQANSQAAIGVIDAAINTVSLQRAQLGAIQNRLQHTINNLSVGSENLNAAQSRIMDVDVAAETVNMTKNQILEQAGISILAQANQQPQMVLKLLG